MLYTDSKNYNLSFKAEVVKTVIGKIHDLFFLYVRGNITFRL